MMMMGFMRAQPSSVPSSSSWRQWRRNRKFRRSNELGPWTPAPPPPEPGAKKIYARKENVSSWSNSRWSVCSLRLLPSFNTDPLAPNLRPQHFRLPVLALGGWLRELRAPKLLLNQGPSEPYYATGWRLVFPVKKNPPLSCCVASRQSTLITC